MALYSRSYYSGDGTTTDFTVGFPYLDKAHVKLYLNGDLSTDWSWIGDTTARIASAPSSGVTILLKRETSPTARIVDYTAPSSLNESDLDDDSLQAFYLNQEALDQANSTVGDDPVTGQFTAANKRLTNVADPVNDQDAATKGWVSSLWTSITATLSDYAASALASKNASATSESNSATSATNAHTSEVNAAASAAAAATSAGTLTPVEVQINAATDVDFTDDDMLTARSSSSGGLLKRSWGNIKEALQAYFDTVYVPVEDQIDGATDADPTDDDYAGFRDTVTGTLIKRSWGSLKTLLAGTFQPLKATLTALGGLANAAGVLTNDGSGSLSWEASSSVTLGTAVAATSGTSIDFSNIPSGVKRITLAASSLSGSGTGLFLVQIGHGSPETTGYSATGTGLISGANPGVASSSSGFCANLATASRAIHGLMTLALQDAGTNTWVESHAFGETSVPEGFVGGGSKSLSGTLTFLRVTWSNGTDTFDGGKLNITWEK